MQNRNAPTRPTKIMREMGQEIGLPWRVVAGAETGHWSLVTGFA